ncbi:gp436 family protein [Paracoccus sp. (in: a-proteobacteria)]|uniref:gp436 family protein n=1 Tax=Paracoccus sp. TaxID=267 RepID=UPI0026DF4B12|nr:DUF1320 domain-containing protein [Paracoccus sp. (in: a-proteobacteria)]MDO5648860.1 DUF1320 domain-containing protein [Paracoccus sp. (in: a-proteobacteria)]
MSYASVSDLKSVIPARDLALLTDFDDSAQVAVDDRLQQALTDATAEIDGYIHKQIRDVPLTAPPHVLNVICRDLAMHRLYRNLGHDTERLKHLRADALAWLRDVAAGRVALGDADRAPPPSSGGIAMTDGPDRQLTRDSLRGY